MPVYALHVCRAHRNQKRTSDPLGMKLQVVMSHHVDAENEPMSPGKAVSTVLLSTEPSLYPPTTRRIIVFNSSSNQQSLLRILSRMCVNS